MGCLSEEQPRSSSSASAKEYFSIFGQIAQLKYEQRGPLRIFDGDILLDPPLSEAEIGKADHASVREVSVNGVARDALWPRAIIPYVIADDFDAPKRVYDAIKDWHDKTNIRFVEHTNQSNYVFIKSNEEGCWAHVGFSYRSRVINVDSSCLTGSVIHELGHTAGLWHEHTREDRDKHITVHFDRIEDTKVSNFEKASERGLKAQMIGPYNVDSIMHYGSYAFSKDGKPTITRVDGRTIRANRSGLHSLDAEHINELYDQIIGCFAGHNFDDDFCSTKCPCSEGQGHCTHYYECQAGLICVPEGARNQYGSAVAACQKAAITVPEEGARLESAKQTFRWSGGADEYWLYIGSKPGTHDLLDSGSLALATSYKAEGLPLDGRTLYVQLWFRRDGDWHSTETTYLAHQRQGAVDVAMTSPATSATITKSEVTFSWLGEADAYWLYVGTSKGAKDIWDSGNLNGAKSNTVSGIPLDGTPLWVTLFYRVDGSWKSNDYQYTTGPCTDCGVAVELVSPTPQSELSGAKQTFRWQGTAEKYWLYVGLKKGGKDLFDSGSIPAETLSYEVAGLPVDGSTLHVQLWYRVNQDWKSKEYTFQACANCGPKEPTITSPASSSTLQGSSQTFSWQGVAEEYWIYIGSRPGKSDYYDSGSLRLATSHQASGLPTDGSTVYVRLWFRRNSKWLSIDSSFTAAQL
jgi:hypothetical protein